MSAQADDTKLEKDKTTVSTDDLPTAPFSEKMSAVDDDSSDSNNNDDDTISRWTYVYALCAALNSCNLGYDIGVSTGVGYVLYFMCIFVCVCVFVFVRREPD
jgi:hypothetical protein